MEPWQVIKLAWIHCCVAIAVVVPFSGTLWFIAQLLSSHPGVVWFLDKVDVMLIVLASVVLAVMFANSLIRICADNVKETWKGFLNGRANSILV
jgi:hypothetical protein